METRLQCDCDFKNTTLNELYQKGYKLVEILNQDTPVYYLKNKILPAGFTFKPYNYSKAANTPC
jgi:hypothetical protein